LLPSSRSRCLAAEAEAAEVRATPRRLRLQPHPPAAPAPTTPPAAGQQGAEADDDADSPLLAWADVDNDEGKAPLTVQFKADIEGGKAPLKIVWKFGDGTPDSNEKEPKHTYEKPGKYKADLEVEDSSGDSDSDYVEIEVQ
jgi:hypothetical protein